MRRRASTVGLQLGQRIRDPRKTLSFTQEELAKRAGIGASYLSMFERAKRMPHFETLVRLAAALLRKPCSKAGRSRVGVPLQLGSIIVELPG